MLTGSRRPTCRCVPVSAWPFRTSPAGPRGVARRHVSGARVESSTSSAPVPRRFLTLHRGWPSAPAHDLDCRSRFRPTPSFVTTGQRAGFAPRLHNIDRGPDLSMFCERRRGQALGHRARLLVRLAAGRRSEIIVSASARGTGAAGRAPCGRSCPRLPPGRPCQRKNGPVSLFTAPPPRRCGTPRLAAARRCSRALPPASSRGRGRTGLGPEADPSL